MFFRKNFDKRTGVYRSKNDIKNFRFRITLKTLHSFLKIPKFNAEKLVDVEDLDEVEFYDFRWQQKRFSAREIEFFGNADNCKSDTEKEYYRLIQKSSDTDATQRRIFSFVRDDKFAEIWINRNAFIENVESNSEWLDAIDIDTELYNENAKEEELKCTRFKNLNMFETMYIMADLEQELLLFTIKYRPNDGLLLVYPDFNHIERNPYVKEVNAESRRFYQYAIENVSHDDCDPNRFVRADIEMIANQLSELMLNASKMIVSPPTNCKFISFYFEIQSGAEFEYDSIHVNFEIILPKNCKWLDGPIKGSTHSSERSQITGRWSLGYSHELSVLCEESFNYNDYLKIVYEVVSIDSWSRERNEGFAMLNLPFEVKEIVASVDCCRQLVDNSWRTLFERYFIGDRRRYLNKEFNGIFGDDSLLNAPEFGLNRFGSITKTTGTLKIQCSSIVQRNINDSAPKRNINRNQQNSMNIVSLLEMYKDARKNLEEITNKNK